MRFSSFKITDSFGLRGAVYYSYLDAALGVSIDRGKYQQSNFEVISHAEDSTLCQITLLSAWLYGPVYLPCLTSLAS